MRQYACAPIAAADQDAPSLIRLDLSRTIGLRVAVLDAGIFTVKDDSLSVRCPRWRIIVTAAQHSAVAAGGTNQLEPGQIEPCYKRIVDDTLDERACDDDPIAARGVLRAPALPNQPLPTRAVWPNA
jgi:hypothetical protein